MLKILLCKRKGSHQRAIAPSIMSIRCLLSVSLELRYDNVPSVKTSTCHLGLLSSQSWSNSGTDTDSDICASTAGASCIRRDQIKQASDLDNCGVNCETRYNTSIGVAMKTFWQHLNFLPFSKKRKNFSNIFNVYRLGRHNSTMTTHRQKFTTKITLYGISGFHFTVGINSMSYPWPV